MSKKEKRTGELLIYSSVVNRIKHVSLDRFCWNVGERSPVVYTCFGPLQDGFSSTSRFFAVRVFSTVPDGGKIIDRNKTIRVALLFVVGRPWTETGDNFFVYFLHTRPRRQRQWTKLIRAGNATADNPSRRTIALTHTHIVMLKTK